MKLVVLRLLQASCLIAVAGLAGCSLPTSSSSSDLPVFVSTDFTGNTIKIRDEKRVLLDQKVPVDFEVPERGVKMFARLNRQDITGTRLAVFVEGVEVGQTAIDNSEEAQGIVLQHLEGRFKVEKGYRRKATYIGDDQKSDVRARLEAKRADFEQEHTMIVDLPDSPIVLVKLTRKILEACEPEGKGLTMRLPKWRQPAAGDLFLEVQVDH